MSAYRYSSGHRSMVFDHVRNDAYARAMERVIGPDSVVLDLGAGVGIHGLMAARMGARKVYLVDPEPVLHVAAEIARANGLEERVECIQGRIEEVELPEPVDVIVSVLTGNFLLTEDLLPSLFHARDKFLASGGHMIPDRARMLAAVVSAEDFYNKHIDAWSHPHQELDFSVAQNRAANSTWYYSARDLDAELLSEPAQLQEIDFRTVNEAVCRESVELVIRQDGLCHGFLGWFDIRLGEAWLSTGPQAPATHWSPMLMPADPPLQVKAGDVIDLKVVRPEDGEWSWVYTHDGPSERRSSFLSVPVDAGTAMKSSDKYHPVLSGKGLALQWVLSQMDGECKSSEIAARLVQEFGEVFPDERSARQFVKKVVARYG